MVQEAWRGRVGLSRWPAVNRRFQIEDLIEQDASGVVFRATDLESGRTVAVRRFFPFGPEGGGLEGDEREAYRAAVTRLAEVSHPALRAVVAGGCDPVDGLPFVATEWIDGESLAERVSTRGPLVPEVAADLLARALEVSETLSRVLGSEAVWVETCPLTIVDDEGGRGFTFWICPRRWLGADAESRSLASLATLAADALGWGGRVVSDQAAGGLGGWMNWLRAQGGSVGLAGARQALDHLPARQAAAPDPVAPHPEGKPDAPPPAAASPAGPAVPPPVQVKPPPTRGPLIASAIAALAVLGLGAWLWITREQNFETVPVEEVAAAGQTTDKRPLDAPDGRELVTTFMAGGEPIESAPPAFASGVGRSTGSTEADAASERAAKLASEAAKRERAEEETRAARAAILAERGGVYHPSDREWLLEIKGQNAVLEGVAGEIGTSSTGRTVYIIFEGYTGSQDPRGAIHVSKATGELSREKLELLVGRRVRLEGRVRSEPGGRRPVIDIASPDAISEAR